MRPFAESNAAYEAWMREWIDVVQAQLDTKHRKMAESPFAFLRATCFRFAETLPELVPDLLKVTQVPSVGDAHLENFGTWRDDEGRLVWGVNDLDEAAELPWTVDLLRLAASALLSEAPAPAHEVVEALLQGYHERLGQPQPFVLEAGDDSLWAAGNIPLAARQKFWAKLRKLAYEGEDPPSDFLAALKDALPKGATDIAFAPRQAGLGSLGRPRFVAMANWRGGPVAREAKSRLPSAYLYARMPHSRLADPVALATAPHRAPDPWFQATEKLVLRRLAPDSQKIEAGGEVSLNRLLKAMGGEIANIHAEGDAPTIKAEEKALGTGWLAEGARRLADQVRKDLKSFAPPP
ncbi:DUF2252 family protein [Roseococcus pinisoli]|uniref:DUF2252 family protein n=1 Tax=Roseococcus pinisoli TaxID=2835040 RepID=A0ABS5QBA0_9PROT|nr:DUF2252 family protein [Roseococcus pinisoli]MBS7809853.1 DUF2252 family protein [Roseococcus pinisoli]